MKSTGNADKPFTVSTLVHNEITVSASAKYDYQLSDMNGREIRVGSGVKGVNKVNVYNLPNGMYIIQLYSNNEKQTERIIRQ